MSILLQEAKFKRMLATLIRVFVFYVIAIIPRTSSLLLVRPTLAVASAPTCTLHKLNILPSKAGSRLRPEYQTKPWSSEVKYPLMLALRAENLGGGDGVNQIVDFPDKAAEDPVPSTLQEAFYTFFLDKFNGPRIIVASLFGLMYWRCQLGPLHVSDGIVAGVMVLFWWIQEHVLHRHALHSSTIDWIGLKIHRQHHARPYMHVSIDSAPLMVGWLATVGVILHLCASAILPICFSSPLLPAPALLLLSPPPPPSSSLAVSATIGYALAGLFYEWAHFVVHTNVRFRRHSYWDTLKQHHIRHHLVDSAYWFGFSLPAVDDVFGTNPTLVQWKESKNSIENRSRNSSIRIR